MRSCWCGNAHLICFSDEYGSCEGCGTLVFLKEFPADQYQVLNDETDFYGRKYWLKHQTEDLGLPDLHTRARNDLIERNLHWLKTLLKYRLPSAKILELGCAHGSFVSLLRQAGYDASGVEMSPWIVEFGKKTFGIPVSVGPVEDINIPPATLDVIVILDVLEHLPDPSATMEHCIRLLKPDGLLLIQTPQYREGMDYAKMEESNDSFLHQLKVPEHLYLFSERAVSLLFQRLEANYIQFEPAIFNHYDMFFAVSISSFKTNDPGQIESTLLGTPNGRLTQALLDLRRKELDCTQKLGQSLADGMDRAGQIEKLSTMVLAAEELKLNLQVLLSRRWFHWLAKIARLSEVKKIAELLNKTNE